MPGDKKTVQQRRDVGTHSRGLDDARALPSASEQPWMRGWTRPASAASSSRSTRTSSWGSAPWHCAGGSRRPWESGWTTGWTWRAAMLALSKRERCLERFGVRTDQDHHQEDDDSPESGVGREWKGQATVGKEATMMRVPKGEHPIIPRPQSGWYKGSWVSKGSRWKKQRRLRVGRTAGSRCDSRSSMGQLLVHHLADTWVQGSMSYSQGRGGTCIRR